MLLPSPLRPVSSGRRATGNDRCPEGLHQPSTLGSFILPVHPHFRLLFQQSRTHRIQEPSTSRPLLVLPQVWWHRSQVHIPLFMDGKQPGWVLMVTNNNGPSLSRLLFVTERTSGLRFLVDTGAEVSVLPVCQLFHSSPPAGSPLQAVNNSSIVTFGMASRTLNLGIRWIYSAQVVAIFGPSELLSPFCA